MLYREFIMPLPKGPKPKDWLEKAAKTKPKRPVDEPGIVVNRAKWASLKEEFIELVITGKPVHWPTLADKYGFKVTTVRHKASMEKWYKEIEDRRKQREDILEAKMVERTSAALDKLNQDFATDEAAIRKRHATFARNLQVKALQRIKDIRPDEMSARDALLMLQMGINEERYALGMTQTYEGPKVSDQNPEFKPVAEQIGGHQRVQKIGLLLLQTLQSKDVDRILDGESAAEDAGIVDVVPKEKK